MLQRVQTIFMTFSALAMILFLFFPIWEKSDTKTEAAEREYVIMDAMEVSYQLLTADGNKVDLLGTQSTLPVAGGAVAAALIMLFSISQYKNRLTQVKLNALFSLVSAGTLIGSYAYILKASTLFEPTVPGAFLVGFFLPIVAMLNNFLANRFIRKDEKLVKSMDRIR